MPKVSRKNGRPGMNLWTIFVLSQVRLCLGTSYDMLHHLSNNDILLRKLLGISDFMGIKSIQFEYQNIYDNVSKLSDAMLSEINDVIVDFCHKKVFKKKETTPFAAQNFSVLNRIALNILKNETSTKRGIKGKRLKAGWSEGYLEKILRI